MKLKELVKQAEGVGIAIIVEKEDTPEENWSVHLLNFNDFKLESILVNSQGSGLHNGEEVKTSQLRHFIGSVEANKTAQVELITPDVFVLNNQFWVSYYVDGKIYDKKFIFEADTIKLDKLVCIDDLNAKGIIKL